MLRSTAECSQRAWKPTGKTDVTRSPRQQLRIGVIGIGGRGALAQHAHRPDQGIRVVAGADINAEARQRFRERYGPDVFVTDDYRDVLARDDVNAVFITTPDDCHEEHAVNALKAGKHVYLEKPMAITIEGCDRILRAARRHGVKLYVGHNMRHMAFVLKMKELIDRGAIGEVRTGWCRHFVGYGGDAYFKDWHAERAKSTGLLLHKAAHDTDVLHWLCGGFPGGSPPWEISPSTTASGIDADRTSSLMCVGVWNIGLRLARRS